MRTRDAAGAPATVRRGRKNPPESSADSAQTERIQKRIAASGFCSRRQAEALIAAGRVAVNGVVVDRLGSKVGPQDVVSVDGKPLPSAELVFLAMNKPKGFVTTVSDPHAERTVMELLPELKAAVKPVGRLDKDTEGLLLFANDGELIHRLTHPRYGVEKEYEVEAKGHVSDSALARLEAGVVVEGSKTAPARIPRKSVRRKAGKTALRIVVHEGRKRQVRLMFEAIGHPVAKLRRVRFGPLLLHRLPRGACRMLSRVEVDSLYKAVGLRA